LRKDGAASEISLLDQPAATRFGIVNEYKQITAPQTFMLHGNHAGGLNFFCGPTVGAVSKGDVGAGGSSRALKVICWTSWHCMPNNIRKIPIAKNIARHMWFNLQ
jgi:hypothetical protein